MSFAPHFWKPLSIQASTMAKMNPIVSINTVPNTVFAREI